MSEIKITSQQETDLGWVFGVSVADEQDSLSYEVKLYEDDWQALTSGRLEPTKLLVKSFEFLLEHEPKESILRKFNLTEIEHFFPEYSEAVKGLIKNS